MKGKILVGVCPDGREMGTYTDIDWGTLFCGAEVRDDTCTTILHIKCCVCMKMVKKISYSISTMAELKEVNFCIYQSLMTPSS